MQIKVPVCMLRLQFSKPIFFRLSESQNQSPTSCLPNLGASAVISTDIRMN